MSETITIQDYSTEFTDVINKVQLEKNESGKSYLYQVKESSKQLNNTDQLNHIINYLVLESGYLMEEQNNNRILFSHPHNSREQQCFYEYFPKVMVMNKFEKKCLSLVDK